MLVRSLFLILGLLFLSTDLCAQSTPQKPTSKPKPKPTKPLVQYPQVHILGLRPGITFDSVATVIKDINGKWHEVKIDTLTRNFGDNSIKIMLLDSIYVRFAYIRMAFVFENNTGRLRRISMTPRMSSVMADRDDDLSEILLLYFGQTWGKPEIQLDLTPAHYRWHRGNIEVKGYIRRGYPLWVIEG
jgi:hypothetical protein